VAESEKEIDGVHYHLTKKCDETHFYKRIIIEDKALKEPLEFVEKVAKFSLADFKRILESNGLQVQHVFGDFMLNEFDEKKSPRLLVVASKKV